MSKNQTSARVVPIKPEEMKKEHLDIISALPGDGLKGKFAPVNVLGTLMKHTGLVGDFLQYWVASKNSAKLSARDQELVILRIAIHYQSDYVWGHHVPVGLEVGLTQEEIDRVVNADITNNWSEYDQALLKATDELILQRQVSDSAWENLSVHLDEYELMDFIHVVTQYIFFSVVNNTFRVELEESIEKIPA